MNKLTVLVIEDDPVWLLKLKEMLDQLKVGATICATSIAQAQHLLSNEMPDLVIAEIVLSDGLSLNLFMNSFREVPVIFQTAYASEDFLKSALTLPYVDFLLKPFERLSLQAAIKILIAYIEAVCIHVNGQ